jgi:diguanylate cyclase (GGDEF)-like protein
MTLVNNFVLNVFSIALLIIIFTHSTKQNKKGTLQSRLFMLMLKFTVLLLVLDIFSRFDGKPDTIYPFINHIANFLVFMLNPVLPSIWLYYVHAQVCQEKEKMRRLYCQLVALNVANMTLVILSEFFGWFYYIDSENIYHRGPYFFSLALLAVALMVGAFAILIANRKRIEKRHFYSLMFFAVPPLAGIFLQVVFYGMPLILNCIAFSLLIVFLNVQNNNIYTDDLTGVYNRKKLEVYMNEKINASTENKTFSAIMIDINNFKAINDTYGHGMGDRALQISANLLNSCLRTNDFIARFGGDEFCIVLDISDRGELEQIVYKINHCIQKYNEFSGQPFKLDYSMGYAVYDCSSGMKLDEFQKKIDILMYEDKQAKKEIVRC